MANKTATLKNQAGDNIYPNIVGDNRNAAIKDSTTIKHTLVDNKISLDLDEAIKGKIDAALQKPTGLTKTKLVGVGASGQENIEIGDNLTLQDGKLAAAGGGGSSIPVVEGTINESGDTITIPSAQTTSFILHTEDFGYVFMNNIPEFGYQSSFVYEYQGSYITYSLIGTGTTINLKLTLVPLATINGTYDDTQEKITLDTESSIPFILSVNGFGKFFINVAEGLYSSVPIISQDDTSVNELTITLLLGANTTINVTRYKVSNTLTETVSLFGKHSILVPKDSADTNILPCSTADNGKVLSVVNGEAQWASASGGVTVTFEN